MNWLARFWKGFTEPLAPSATKSAEPPGFTADAQLVLVNARKEAERLKHGFVGTEHVLLGIVHLKQGLAIDVLNSFGLDAVKVQREVERYIGSGPDEKLAGNIPYTPRVKKVLALAMKEARSFKQKHVGAEHILLGMLREADGVAGRVLVHLGLDLEKTRQEVVRKQGRLNPPASGSLST